jgi:hypothetical protein
MFDIFDENIVELKPGWFIRKPVGFTQLDMARCRFDPISILVGTAATASAPATAGIIGAGGAVTAGGVALAGATTLIAGGTIQQGRLAKAQGSAQNKIAQYNAQQLERQSQARMEAASMEESRVARQARLYQGAQRASIAKSGLSLTEGSPLDLQADTAYQFALDRAFTLRSGLIDSQSLQAQGVIQRVEGKWAKGFGKSSAQNSYMQAAGTILGAAYMAGKGASGAGSAGGSSTSGAWTKNQFGNPWGSQWGLP